MRLHLAPVASLLVLSLAACGGSTESGANPAEDTDPGTADTLVDPDSGTPETGDEDTAPPVDNGAPSDVYPAPHPPFPTLVNQAGGAILETPKVYLTYYGAYEFATEMQTFAKNVGATKYWKEAVGEWGVGPITYVDTKVLTEAAPATISDAEVETFFTTKIKAGEFGTPDTNTIYTVFFPRTTKIKLSGGFGGPSESCTSFGGYHSDVEIDGKLYAFAVLPTCASFGGLSAISALSGSLSHEWAEAATDPYPSTNGGADGAYGGVDADHVVWNVLGGAENGDLCAQRPDAFFKSEPGFDFVVQSCWSNVAAKKGGDPCAPKFPGVYFNAAPVATEKVKLDLSAFGGGSVNTLGVKIAKGESKTIEVDLFSDADTKGAFKVTAVDAIQRFTGGAASMTFAWDRTSGVNGEKLHLTVTVTGTSPFGKAHPILLASTLGKITQTWPFLVSE
ncbi:MAG: hypothetical protein ABI175_24300 [Polyangiales bacterium]